MTMIKFLCLDHTMSVPQKATPRSVGFDLYVRGTHILQPGEEFVLPLGVVVSVPPGYFTVVVPRSSTYRKTGLLQVNSVGIIDPDFCGPNDELKIHVKNISDEVSLISHNEALFQLIVFKYDMVSAVMYRDIEEWPHQQSRGGFGSTDK